MKRFAVDLHIHTNLSPWAEWEMSPRNIVRQSRRVGLDIIAVCDHNSMENAEAVSMAAKGTGLVVMTGMEIYSREEAHVLAIFGQTVQAREMQACFVGAGRQNSGGLIEGNWAAHFGRCGKWHPSRS